MTNLTIKYRPSNKTLIIENADLDQSEPNDDLCLHYPPGKMATMVMIDYIERNGEVMFLNLASFDCFDKGSSWMLWMSEFLSDDDIILIEGMLTKWQEHYETTMTDAELIVRIMFTYDTTLTVTLEK